MIPSNPTIIEVDKTTRLLRAPFQEPDNRVETTELVDYEFGGLAIQDPSLGLQHQIWTGYWSVLDSTAYLVSELSPTPVAIFTQSDVIEFTFTFDQNMRWSAATRSADNTLTHRWYDSSINDYVVTTYPNISSVRLTHDDKREVQVQLGTSDMILTYISGGYVKWRIQRDRFLTEYTHFATPIPAGMRISHFGMNSKNRLQWRIGVRRIK